MELPSKLRIHPAISRLKQWESMLLIASLFLKSARDFSLKRGIRSAYDNGLSTFVHVSFWLNVVDRLEGISRFLRSHELGLSFVGVGSGSRHF